MIPLIRPIASLDLETTGTDPSAARVVEVGVVRLDVDGTRSERCWRVNPGVLVPPEASAVHGITDADVRDCPPFANVAAEIATVLHGCDVVVYNGRAYDLPLLRAEYGRAGVAYPLDGARVVDAYVLYRERERHTLSNAVRLYCGREHTGAHGAIADATATLEVFARQLMRYPDLAAMDLDALDRESGGRREDWASEAGHIRWSATGEAVFGFGRHAGKRLVDERRYAGWVVGEKFPDDVRDLCARAARGESVRRPTEAP